MTKQQFRAVNSKQSLSYRSIFWFWLPLATTWLMMSVEGPFLAAVLGRLPDEKYNLAAYGVAFSFAMIIESPIIMLLSASTALVNHYRNFVKLFRFTLVVNILITTVMALLLIPNVFDHIVSDIIRLPEPIRDRVYWATVFLIPWPSAIGFRRFYQGVLIRANQTRRVAYGTVVRLSGMFTTAILMFHFSQIHSAWIGTIALSVGVTAESIATRLMTQGAIRRLRENDSDADLVSVSYRDIARFYFPLALTSILTMGVHPMVTFFLGQSRMAVESLAVLPVVNSLVFIFRSVGLSFQEVIIALLNDGRSYRLLRNFAVIIAATTTVALIGLAYTPLSAFWFQKVSGLSLELSRIAVSATKIVAIFPSLVTLISFQRGILIYAKETRPITIATILEVAGIILALWFTTVHLHWIGVFGAASAYLFGRFFSNTWLTPPMMRNIHRITADTSDEY